MRNALSTHGLACLDYKPGLFRSNPEVQEGGQCVINVMPPDPNEGSYITGLEVYRTAEDRAAVDGKGPGVLSGAYHVDGHLWRVEVLFNPDLGAKVATALGGTMIKIP